jgi:tRNA(Ile)-lysidine synthase
MIETKIRNFIQENSLIHEKERILVAYSGGPDSTCLLMILRKLFPQTAAVYVNHHLRGAESREEEKFVREFCRRKRIPLFVEEIQWSQIPSNLEDAARKRRYRHLAKVAKEQNFQKIALAHHKDDVVENFLLRLIRGSGPRGLGRMKVQRDIYIRPILNVERKEILDYLNKNSIPYFSDSSNQDSKFARNRIRNELIPYIQKNFNPSFPEMLQQTSQWLEEQTEVLNELLQPFAKLLRAEKNAWNLSRQPFLKLNTSLQKAVLMNLLARMDTRLILTARSLQALLNAIRNQKGMELPGLLKMQCNTKTCKFVKKEERTGIVEVDVPAVGQYQFNLGNSKLTFTRTGKMPAVRGKTDGSSPVQRNRFIAFLDAEKASFPLYIRNWKSGDSFRPLGLKGTQKLSDYFINKKIPRNSRKSIPLVFKDDDLVWVAGYQIHHDYRITETTKKFLKIELS